MSNDNIIKRKALALKLITQLKNVRDHLKKISTDLDDSSTLFLSKVYEDHNEKIQEKVDLFNKNVERVKNLNHEITAVVNDWYAFIKSEKELRSLFFPIRLYFKRKQMQSKSKELKQEITSISIKNRLIREDIQRLESNLEHEATLRLKKNVQYEDYLSHLKTKTQLIDEIKYLIPTLSGVPIREIHIDQLEEVLASLCSE